MPCNKPACAYCCWVPPFPKPNPCTDLALNVETEETEGDVIYSFTITNNGPLPVNNTILTVTFTGIFVSGTPGWNINGNVATFNAGAIAISGSVNLFLRISIPSSITGVVSSELRDCNPSNNSVTALGNF